MWKQRAAELQAWLSETPPTSHGARAFLLERMGVRPATKWTPGHAFGLEIADPENEWPPARVEPGADSTGVLNLDSGT